MKKYFCEKCRLKDLDLAVPNPYRKEQNAEKSKTRRKYLFIKYSISSVSHYDHCYR